MLPVRLGGLRRCRSAASIASFIRRIAEVAWLGRRCGGASSPCEVFLPASKAALLRAASALKGALRGLYGLLRRELVEFMGAGARRARAFVTESALAAASGRTSVVRNAWIAEAIRRYLPNLRFTFRPRFSPYLEPFGVSVYRRGTQLGRLAFASTRELVDTLVHEELHHRWWSRGIKEAHHVGQLAARFELTLERYKRYVSYVNRKLGLPSLW